MWSHMKKFIVVLLAGVVSTVFVAESSFAAMQIRKRPAAAPSKEAPAKAAPKKGAAPGVKPAAAKKAPPRKAPPRKSRRPTKESFVGMVSYVVSRKVLVELDAEPPPKQRYVAYDIRLRRKGTLRVVSAKGRQVYLCQLISGSVDEGDRLVMETESEAYARVRRSKSIRAMREFMELYPKSEHGNQIAMRMFRLTLRENYPAEGGSTVAGKVDLTEKVGSEIGLGRTLIKIDRFVIAMTEDNGTFKVEGIPELEYPVKARLRVRDSRFRMDEEIEIELPAKERADLTQDIPVKLTPTYLVGQVLDGEGKPVRGAQVWTAPYTSEKLTDESGRFSISRKKELDESGAPAEGDEPLMGRDYEVYAYRRGYGAERVDLSAASFQENEVKTIVLRSQDSLDEGLPEPDISLRDNLDLMQYVVSAGAGPKINR